MLGHTNCLCYMIATSNMRTSLPHKALSSTPSHSSSSPRQAIKGRRARSSSPRLEGHVFSSPLGSPKPQSHHHLVYKPLPPLWLPQSLLFPRLFLHPLPPTHTVRMPLLFRSRHPDSQPLLLPRRRITHMPLPMFLLRTTLTLRYIPPSHRSHISRPHRSRIPREMCTASLYNNTAARLYHLLRHLLPRRLLLHPRYRRRHPSVARTVVGTMRHRSRNDALPAGLLTSQQRSRRLSQTPGQFRQLCPIRRILPAVSLQPRLLHPPVLVVYRGVPLRHPLRVASRSRLRMWLPRPDRTHQPAQAQSLRWRIHQMQSLRGRRLRDSLRQDSTRRLHSVAMWPLHRRRLTHTRAVLLLLAQGSYRHHKPVRSPCHLLVLTVA